MSAARIAGTAAIALILGVPVIWALLQMAGATNEGMFRLAKIGVGFALIAVVALAIGLLAMRDRDGDSSSGE